MSSGYEDDARNSKDSDSDDHISEDELKAQNGSKNHNMDDEDDVFSSGEEEMMQRMAAMRTNQGSTGRRSVNSEQ